MDLAGERIKEEIAAQADAARADINGQVQRYLYANHLRRSMEDAIVSLEDGLSRLFS